MYNPRKHLRSTHSQSKPTFLAGAFFAVLAFLAGFFAAVVLAFPVVALDFFAADVYFLGVVVLAAVLDEVPLVAFGFEAGALVGFSVVTVVVVAAGFLVAVVFLVVVALALAAGFLLAGLVF
jgi:hypothetical protein